MKRIKIADKFVGENDPCFVVAEAGANHDSILERAFKLVDEAAEAGADAIKFQTYTAGKIATKTAPKYWKDDKPKETQYEVFDKLDKLTEDDWRNIVKRCKEKGIIFMSTPFDEGAVDFLDELDMPVFKIASADLTDHPLVKRIAEKGKPIILSTGLASIGEIEETVNLIKSTGNEDIILLHCIISYPTAFKDANLRMIKTLQTIFPDIPIGFSDHTPGPVIPAVAVALGAKVIEKHYTIDKKLPGSPDHPLSVDPDELRQMVENIRNTEVSLGLPLRFDIEAEREGKKYARRSVVAAIEIPKGTVITRNMITHKRPGTGISPRFFDMVIGRVARKNIKEDQVITWDDV